jgi:hypothetical protein
MRSACVLCACMAAGCIGPQVEDEPGPGNAVLPAGSELPDVEDDPELAEQIEENDGVDALVPIVNGFADGVSRSYWDFGPAPAFSAPIFVLFRRDGTNLVRVPHPPLVEVAPGDPGYSPYWAVFQVIVTDDYRDEVIPSVAAIDEAVRRGLVEPPVYHVGEAVNCPVVADDVMLERPGGMSPVGPPSVAHYRGVRIHYFDVGHMPIDDDTVIPEVRRYVLRREGQEPLSERIRNVDMTGDGDTHDTNDVLDLAADDPLPSPSCRRVDVAVPTNTASIDTSMDQAVADIKRATQLFAPGPVTGTVVAFQETDELRNCAPVRGDVP